VGLELVESLLANLLLGQRKSFLGRELR